MHADIHDITLIFMIVIECIVALMEEYRSGMEELLWKWLVTYRFPQFYHVSIDDKEPYNVYGGLQDNGSGTTPQKPRRN
jgi:hypothetical protein